MTPRASVLYSLEASDSPVTLITPQARVRHNMASICKPAGVSNLEQLANEGLSTYPTVPLINKTPRTEYMPPIDPSLLEDMSHMECATPPMLQFQQPPVESSLDAHLARTTRNEPVSYQPLGYVRHESPFSIQNSPGYSLAPSPSIGSDMYYDIAHGPATPPDAPMPFFPLPGGPHDAVLECPQSNAYVDLSAIASYPTPQSDETESVADNAYFGLGIGIADSYHYNAALRSPSLIPRSVSTDGRHIAAENGTNNKVFSVALPYHHDPVGMVVDAGSPKQALVGHNTTSEESVTMRSRCGRTPRRATTSVIGKRASPYEVAPPHSDKRPRFMSSPKSCVKCKVHFRDRKSHDDHMRFEHPRPYICVFHYAGCTSRFDAKNEWKRHVSTKHLGLKYWLCTEGNCAQARGSPTHKRSSTLPEYGNIFNRKDLYTQHVRRMHSEAAGQSMIDHKKSTPESDERLKRMQDDAVRVRCQLPTYMPCPAEHCNMVFRGATAWDDRMEHVAQQHFENSAAGREPPIQFGGPNDTALTDWARRPDVHIVKQSGLGWELCDPLKGESGIRRMSVEAFDEDAEGELVF